MPEFKDESYANSKPSGGGLEVKTQTSNCYAKKWVETSGFIECPNGMVRAYASTIYSGGAVVSQRTSFRTNLNGRTYFRTYHNKHYSQRYMVTLANRFLNDLINKED